MTEHKFAAAIRWTGNRGTGTSAYRDYDRSWDIAINGKQVIHCSNDPMLGGDPALHNPEDLLISALSACHMLWYLHLCANAGVIVFAYEDFPVGYGDTEKSGAGRFVSALLRPKVTISPDSDTNKAFALHHEIHKHCFIARSVNFPVNIEPEIATGSLQA
jgi:organic hydroperoxide reductase OsmC/OhrA